MSPTGIASTSAGAGHARPLGDVPSSVAVDPPVPDWNRMVPVIATAIAAPVLILVVVWRFERGQF